jgi:hypothetical protein
MVHPTNIKCFEAVREGKKIDKWYSLYPKVLLKLLMEVQVYQIEKKEWIEQ